MQMICIKLLIINNPEKHINACWIENRQFGTIVKNNMPKKENSRDFSRVVKELKQKIAELEKMQADIRTETSPITDTKTLIEEIHVPALELLKEKKHAGE